MQLVGSLDSILGSFLFFFFSVMVINIKQLIEKIGLLKETLNRCTQMEL